MASSTNIVMPEDLLRMDRDAISRSIINHVQHTQGKHPIATTLNDEYWSVARMVRDRLADRWTRTWHRNLTAQPKRVYYLSMEYLLGRLLEDGLLNLGIEAETRDALQRLGIDYEDVVDQEEDPGIGNGGLGRLAACFLDSMATLGIAGMGYGIRYEFGIFRQTLVQGEQVEMPDNWLRLGNPWEVARPERQFQVHFGGRVIQYTGRSGELVHEWVDTEEVLAMAYDVPVPGFRNGVVNTLRLWSAKATQEFDITVFNRGDYIKSVEDKSQSENISRVLYPRDDGVCGKELRLKQEFFLVSATLQDALHRHLTRHRRLDNLPEFAVFQLNDTHPALAIAELMRLLVDVHGMRWEAAWEITRRSMAYTNHTIMPEALERWPVWMMQRLLPRHLQIIYQINFFFLEDVKRRFPDDIERLRRVSIIEEGSEKKVRMANLALVGCHRVNGVSELHTELLRHRVFRDFDELHPDKISNKTNGVTPRRWLLKCNPELAALITSRIGDTWPRHLERLTDIAALAHDPEFQSEWRAVKRRNKERLSGFLQRRFGVTVNPDWLVDSQVKRVHEYKRQLLNILHVVLLYLECRRSGHEDMVPRTFVFSGKAAPGYIMAKRIIHLVTSVARVINADPAARDRLKVLYVPNYGVTIAEQLIPATDVSEQISTAGTEASGTGNMKFALNGALTVGTLDGANIEIKDAVGAENMFLFGLTAEEVSATQAAGYRPEDIYHADPDLRAVLDAISVGMFCPEDPGRFRPIVDNLLAQDRYLVLADFRSYVRCHRTVGVAYRDQASWTSKAITNVAHMGRFSSDRTILQYARDIWEVPIDAE